MHIARAKNASCSIVCNAIIVTKSQQTKKKWRQEEMQITMGREGGLQKELSLGKGSDGSQDLPLEATNLLKVFARIEARRQEKLHASRKEVA